MAGAVRVVPDGPEASVVTATLDRATIRQDREAPLVAPVEVTGEARLADEALAFSGALATPAGLPLGRAEGRHDLTTASGRVALDTGTLAFAAGGLQPARLLPALSGRGQPRDGDSEGRRAGRVGPPRASTPAARSR